MANPGLIFSEFEIKIARSSQKHRNSALAIFYQVKICKFERRIVSVI